MWVIIPNVRVSDSSGCASGFALNLELALKEQGENLSFPHQNNI